MAKKHDNDFDLDADFNVDFGAGGDEFNPEATNNKKSRSPITQSYKGIGKAVLKGGAKEVVSRNTLKKVVDRALPSEYGELLGQADQATRIVRTLQDDAVKTLKPHSQSLVRKLDKLVTKEDSFLRRSVDGAKRKLGIYDPRDNGPSADEIQDSAIAESLDRVFTRQEVAQRVYAARGEAENQRRESIETKRYTKQLGVSSDMAQDVSSMRRYQDTVGQAWQRKMLELTYRQTFLQTKLLNSTMENNEAVLRQLESIVHNTALPEFSKITLSESWRESSRNKLIDVGNRALFGEGDWLRKGGENLRKQFGGFLNGVSERLQAGDQAMEQLMEAKASMDSMKDFMSPQEMAEMKAEMGGAALADWIMDKTVGKLKSKVPGKAAEYPARILNATINGRQTIEGLRDTDFVKNNEWTGGPKGLAARLLGSIGSAFAKQNPDTELMAGNSVRELDDPNQAGFDKRTHISINEIIPGYLARILQETRRNGGDPNPEMLHYDIRSNKFKTSKAITQDVRRRVMENFEGDHQRSTARSTIEKYAPGAAKKDRKSAREAETFLMDYAESGGRMGIQEIKSSDLYERLSPKAQQIIDDMLSSVESDDMPEVAKLNLWKRIQRVGNSGPNASGTMQDVLREGHGWALERLGFGQYDRDGAFQRDDDKHRDLARSWGTHMRTTDRSKTDVIRSSMTRKPLENSRVTGRSRMYAYFATSGAMTLGLAGAGWGRFKDDRFFQTLVDAEGYENACRIVSDQVRTGPNGPISDREREDIYKEILKANKPKRRGGAKSKDDPVGAGPDGIADSDINLKHNITRYNPGQALAQIKNTGVYNWAYKKDGIPRVGPMAQDVRAKMGEDAAPGGRSIDLVSMNGKSMAAIQALADKVDKITASAKTKFRNVGSMFGKRDDDGGEPNRIAPKSNLTINELLTSMDRRLADLVTLTKLQIDMGGQGGVQIQGLFTGLLDHSWKKLKVGGAALKSGLGKVWGYGRDKWDESEDVRDHLGRKIKTSARRHGRGLLRQARHTLNTRLPNANRAAQGWFQSYYDVYTKDDLENPVLFGNLLKDGQYFDKKTGKQLKYMSDIRGQVKDASGNVVLTRQHYKAGLVTADGKPVSFKWEGWLDLATNLRDGIRSRAAALGQKILDKLQFVQDVYVKGEIEPRLTALKIEAGLYIDQTTGKVIESLADIRGTVMDTAGNVILDAKDFKKGLVDRYGKELALKFRNLRDLVTAGLGNGIRRGGQFLGFMMDAGRAAMDVGRDLIGRARENWQMGAGFGEGKTISNTLLEIRAILQTHLGPADPSLLPKVDAKGEFTGPPPPGVFRRMNNLFKDRFGKDYLRNGKPKSTSGSGGTTGGGSDDVDSDGDGTPDSRDPDQVGTGGFAVGAGVWSMGRNAINGLRNSAAGDTARGMFKDSKLGRYIDDKRRAYAAHRAGDETSDTFVGPVRPGEPQPERTGMFGKLSSAVNGVRERYRDNKAKREAEAEGKDDAQAKTEDKPKDAATKAKELVAKTKAAIGKNPKRKSDTGGGEDWRDNDGDGARDGNYRQRQAEIEAKRKANSKAALKGNTVAKYTEGGVFQQLYGMISGIGGKIMGMLGGAGSLISGISKFLGLTGAGGLFSKAKSFLGFGNKAAGAARGASTVANAASAANAASKGGMLARGLQGLRTIGAPLARYGTKALPVINAVRNAGTVVSLLGGVGSLVGGAVSIGASILGTIASSPVLAGAAVVAGLAYGGYKAYKYFTRNSTDEWQSIRVKQYGLRNDDKDKQFVSKLMELEGYFLDGLVSYGPGGARLLTAKINHARILEIFEADPEDAEHAQTIKTYLDQRFIPFFINAVSACYLADPRGKLSAADKLKPEAQLKFLNGLMNEGGPYHVSISPFKDLPSLTTSKDPIKNDIEALKKKVAVQSNKDKKAKEAEDKKIRSAEDLTKRVMDDHKAKKEAAAKAEAEARAKAKVPPAQNVKTTPPKVVSNTGTGDGAAPAATKPTAVQAPAAASGPLASGDGGSKWLQLAKGETLSGLHPTMQRQLYGMAEEYGRLTGKAFLVTSGTRSYEQQVAMYNKYGSKGAAKPGTSLHEKGLAIDINSPDANKLESLGLMRKYGFTRPVAGELWHTEPAGIQVNINGARSNPDLAASLIAAGVGRGGGGYAMVNGQKGAGRNADLARSLLNLPGKNPGVEAPGTQIQQVKGRGADTARPVTPMDGARGGAMRAGLNRPSTTRPATTNGMTSGGTQPVSNDGDGQAPRGVPSRSPAGFSGGIENRDRSANTGGSNKPGAGKIKAPAGVRDGVIQASRAVGADPNKMLAFAAMESGLNPNAYNKGTRASGLFQFLPATWQEQLPRASAKYDLGPNPAPEDAVASTIVTHNYMQQNLRGTTNPTVTDMYLTHFLGAAGYRRFKSYSPDTIAANVMPAAAKSNPDIFYQNGRALTIGEVYNNFTKKIAARASQLGISLDGKDMGDMKMVDNGNTGRPSLPGNNGGQGGGYQSTVSPAPSAAPSGGSRYSNYGGAAAETVAYQPSQNQYIKPAGTPEDYGQSPSKTVMNSSLDKTNSILAETLAVDKEILAEIKKLVAGSTGKSTADAKAAKTPEATKATPATATPATKSPTNGMTATKPSGPSRTDQPTPRVSLARYQT